MKVALSFGILGGSIFLKYVSSAAKTWFARANRCIWCAQWYSICVIIILSNTWHANAHTIFFHFSLVFCCCCFDSFFHSHCLIWTFLRTFCRVMCSFCGLLLLLFYLSLPISVLVWCELHCLLIFGTFLHFADKSFNWFTFRDYHHFTNGIHKNIGKQTHDKTSFLCLHAH